MLWAPAARESGTTRHSRPSCASWRFAAASRAERERDLISHPGEQRTRRKARENALRPSRSAIGLLLLALSSSSNARFGSRCALGDASTTSSLASMPAAVPTRCPGAPAQGRTAPTTAPALSSDRYLRLSAIDLPLRAGGTPPRSALQSAVRRNLWPTASLLQTPFRQPRKRQRLHHASGCTRS